MAHLSKKRRPRPWDTKRTARAHEHCDVYNSRLWRGIAHQHRTEDPLCAHCLAEDQITEAVMVDHIIPIKHGGSVTDRRNHQGLCHHHHQVKRGRERHGYCADWQLNDQGEKIPLQNKNQDQKQGHD